MPTAVLMAPSVMLNRPVPEHEHRRDRDRHDEEEDASVRDQVTEDAHRDGCRYVARRVERLVAPLADVECSRPTIPSDIAQMAGMKTLEVPPIKTWAPMTGQNDGNSAISSRGHAGFCGKGDLVLAGLTSEGRIDLSSPRRGYGGRSDGLGGWFNRWCTTSPVK
jgi:hypothetical protein